MKAVVLSAVPRDHEALTALARSLEIELGLAGCKIADRQQEIVAAIPSADALVLLGPIAFGGFGWELKRAIDRLICLLAPFFEKRAALTHHERRYPRYPAMFHVGLTPAADDAQRATVDALNDANALNLFAPLRGAAALDAEHPDAWRSAIAAMLAGTIEPGATITDRAALREELLDAARPDDIPHRETPRTAALLVGSAKAKGTSASEEIGRAFARNLAKHGVTCEVHFATEFVREKALALEAAQAIAAADLFLVATPLYVDALPALTTHALELVAAARTTARNDALFVPVINCGFPFRVQAHALGVKQRELRATPFAPAQE